MKNVERGLLTIDELSARVAEALSVGYEGVQSNRVRDVPDLRTIRYYTTLGLLDRPAAMQGRTALYGPRHLLQLVAIKHLQAQGLSLAAIQERLLGASDAVLRRITERPSPKRNVEPPPSRGDSFWRLTAKVPAGPEKRTVLASLSARADQDETAPPASSPLQTIPLDKGLLLSLPSRREVNEEDLRAIRAAAASLIEILKLRGLIDLNVETEPKPGALR